MKRLSAILVFISILVVGHISDSVSQNDMDGAFSYKYCAQTLTDYSDYSPMQLAPSSSNSTSINNGRGLSRSSRSRQTSCCGVVHNHTIESCIFFAFHKLYKISLQSSTNTLSLVYILNNIRI